MGLLNWVVAKAMGLPSVDENCKTSVISFLGQNNVVEPKFTVYKGEQSGTNRQFFYRLYVGTGHRGGQAVSFILHVNEDIPRPHGALYSQPITNADAIYREWVDFGEFRGQLYGFFAEKLDQPLEKLEPRYD
jgi:hypothetical protein